MFGFNKEEINVFRKLNSPKKIQDFLNEIPINFENDGDTCMSPKKVLKENKAHCIEGAMFAAMALKIKGEKPLLVDLTASKNDYDHVVCVFRRNKKWGAMSKTNRPVLRYREPIYKNIRELVMSYFHEYLDNSGKKSLRSYSVPLNLEKLDHLNWATSEEDVWFVPEALNKARHFPILNINQIRSLRKPDKNEINAGKICDWENISGNKI
jgi:hypothetical protein